MSAQVEKKRVLLVIPAYNEEQNILSTIAQVAAFQPGGPYELSYLVVNDGSTDRTGQLCRENGIHCLDLVQNLGIGGAVQSGYRYGRSHGYDVVVQFDGDGQHDIRCLDDLLAPIWAGESDFVIGSRFLGNTSGFRSSAMRRVGIRFLSGLIRLVSGARVTDPTSGFRAAGTPVTALFADHYPVDYPEPESIITLIQQGFTIREVGVNMFERAGGKSSITPLRSIYYMFKVSLAILCNAMHRKER